MPTGSKQFKSKWLRLVLSGSAIGFRPKSIRRYVHRAGSFHSVQISGYPFRHWALLIAIRGCTAKGGISVCKPIFAERFFFLCLKIGRQKLKIAQIIQLLGWYTQIGHSREACWPITCPQVAKRLLGKSWWIAFESTYAFWFCRLKSKQWKVKLAFWLWNECVMVIFLCTIIKLKLK